MLDKNGFKRKTYQDLKEDLENKFKEKFGGNINISSKSAFGMLIAIFAWFLSLIWELAESVYNSAYSSKAEGVQLDRLATNRLMSRDLESESSVELVFTGMPSTLIEEQTQFATEKFIYFYLVEDVILDENGNGSGQAVSVEKGINTNVAANTITMQAQPNENVYTVNNPLSATGGRDAETDTELRERLINSPAIEGNTTLNSIISKLNDTSGVRSSTVLSLNPVVHAYVLGGNREDVANTLFNCVAAGIDTIGSEEVTVTDISGNNHIVRFDYAVEVDIKLRISIQANTSFPSDGIADIKQLLIQEIGGKDAVGVDWKGLAMGKPVIYSHLFSYVYETAGIDDVTIEVAKNEGAFTMGNLALESYEIARTNPNFIEVKLI